MERIVKQVQAFSSTEKDLQTLTDFLKKSEGSINKNLNNVDEALQQLDPSAHTVGFLHLLAAKSTRNIENVALFIQQCSAVLRNADAKQAQMEAKRFAAISHKFTQAVTECNVPKQGVATLRQATRKLQVTGRGELTAVHADFLQVCLLSKCYFAAVPILENEVLGVGNAKKVGFTQSDYLRYFYYGGLVYTGLKQFKKAIDFFERALSPPAVVVSAIMFEAYKKHMLVSLILRGSVTTKRNNNGMLLRSMKQMSAPYQEFATAYGTKDAAALRKVAVEHNEAFVADRNWGLVQQAIESLADRQIRSFTQTYIRLSLKALADGAGVESEEQLRSKLLNMVKQGTLVASINEKEGMVSFGEAEQKFSDAATVSDLNEQIKRVIRLADLLRDKDEEIASSQEFIQKTSMHEGRGGFEEAAMMGGVGQFGVGGGPGGAFHHG